jgi:dipeptidase D
MATAIDGLEPALVWKHFAALSRIPRCSKSEAAAAAFVVETARSFGLPVKQDGAGNVVVAKPASKGREGAPSVCLQGHLDMVCEKNADKVHDFSRDPIELVRRDGVLMANGTTLGADNGIAVATNLAVMEDRTLEHGPLEFLFTVDEETGLTGANRLEPGFVQSSILLNLDSEDEGVLYVGCAGGVDTVGTWTVEYEIAPSAARAVEITVSGLRGGHSGLEIDKGRGNALKILNRVLMDVAGMGARLARIDGGNKRNAIPREAHAVVVVPSERLADVQQAIATWQATVKSELGSVEQELAIRSAAVAGANPGVLKEDDQRQITQLLAALPHGVLKMSADLPGLVETSTNVAVIATQDNTVTLATSQRSSVASELREIEQTVVIIFELGGARVTRGDGYPGWKPNMGSPILATARSTYKALFNKDPDVRAVHAGLECGIIGEKYPGIDMVSFGPTLQGVHSPDERIHIDTVPKFYSFLLGILENVM